MVSSTAKRIRLGNSVTVSVLLIGLLTGTLGLGYTYWYAKETRRTTIGLYFQELARHSADKVSLMLAKEVKWVERLSMHRQVREAVRQGRRLAFDDPELKRWREEQHRYFRSLVIVDREGHLVGGVTSEATRARYGQQPWWPIVFGQGRPWASDLWIDEKGRGYWEVAVPVSDDGGAVLGVLKVAIGTDELFASVLRTGIGQTGHVMVLGTKGQVLVCPILPPALHTKIDAFTGRADGRDPQALEGAWAEVSDDTHGGRGGIVGVAPVVLPAAIAQERVWYTLVRQDPKEIYGPTRALMWKLAGLWVGGIGLIALLGWKLAHRIVRPLEELVERVRQLEEGQVPQRLAASGASAKLEIAEIETLATSFNRMAERLDAASQETRQYVARLETANRELTRSESHYRTLWNHAADAKLIVDAGGTVQDVNRRAELKLARSASEVVGTMAADLFVDPDRARFRELLEQMLATGKEMASVEMHVPAGAGATLTMDLDMVSIEQSGKENAVLVQLSDITDKKLLEQQLLRSERLASLSHLASMFAHDIRNPLAGIKKTLELLGHRKGVQAEPVGRLLGDLQFTTELLLGMINDMLDVYQESYSGLPLIPSRFSVGTLLQEVAHLFRSEAEAKGVTIRLHLPEEVMVTGDRRRLQRVAVNLVHNALKYSPWKGTIRLVGRTEQARGVEAGSGEPDAAVLLIRVEDEGPGVAPDDLPHLFEMFFRKSDGHDPRIGRGLGLHFCRLVVEAHGGRIWAANQPTGGAVFSLELPLSGEVRCPSGS